MAQNFDITSAVATVTASPATSMRGEVPFTVKNVTGRRLRVGARVRAAAPAQEAWFRIAGEAERDFAAGEVAQYVVQVQAPAATPEGTARFHLQIFAMDEPSEVYTDGPTVTLAVSASAAPPQPPPRRRFPWWIPVAAGVLLAIVGVSAWFLLRGPSMVKTPDVRGKTYAAAEDQLVAAKLAARPQDEVASTPEQVGKVLRQDPSAGQELPSGGEVALFMGVAPTLPSQLVGKALAEAEKTVASAGLKAVSQEAPAKSPDELGKIIEIRPSTGELAPGGTVTLVVGVEPIVPNVVLMESSAAESSLKARGFSVERTNEVTSAVAADRVIRQTPAGGQKVKPQSTVSLVVAAAPQPVAVAPQPVEVPYMVKMPSADAQGYLRERGLVAKVTNEESATVDAGIVIRHSPGAGARLAPNSPVILVVAVPKSCEATLRRRVEDNKAFVEFSLPKGNHGDQKRWSNGAHTQYEFPTCRKINWANILFTCDNGKWVATSGNYSWDALCHGNTADDQKDMKVGVQR